MVPLLSHPNDEIVREVLAFLKAILYSGNHHVQRGMEHLLTTREERLFSTMQALLTHAAITYKERYVWSQPGWGRDDDAPCVPPGEHCWPRWRSEWLKRSTW